VKGAQLNEARVAEMRALISSANFGISFAEADSKARDYAREEQAQAELAALTAAVEEAERADEARRAAQRDLFSAGGNSGGPSSSQILTQLQEAFERGEGW
jgi:hypothetical protein